MKKLVALLIFLAIVAFAAIVSKPSDEQCVELIKSKINVAISKKSSNYLVNGLGSILVDMGVSKMLFRIEDKIFYKNVYLIVGDKPIGTAIFGTIIISFN